MKAARTVTLGALYFLLVFAAGFVLGTIRVLLVVPRIGVRAAELTEIPIMIVVTVVAAWWIVRRYAVPFRISTRLAIGAVGLALLLVAEFGVAAPLQGRSIRESILNRDPVSGPAYFVSLGLFAVMPALVSRRERDLVRPPWKPG